MDPSAMRTGMDRSVESGTETNDESVEDEVQKDEVREGSMDMGHPCRDAGDVNKPISFASISRAERTSFASTGDEISVQAGVSSPKDDDDDVQYSGSGDATRSAPISRLKASKSNSNANSASSCVSVVGGMAEGEAGNDGGVIG